MIFTSSVQNIQCLLLVQFFKNSKVEALTGHLTALLSSEWPISLIDEFYKRHDDSIGIKGIGKIQGHLHVHFKEMVR